MSTSREAVRDSLRTLLETSLVGAGLPVKTVMGSKASSLEGITPLITVLSDGTERKRMTFGDDRPLFYLILTTYVQQEEGAWTNAMAIDALDCIEASIAQVFEDNRCGTAWDALEYNGRSTVTEGAIAGVPCYIETIPVLASLTSS